MCLVKYRVCMGCPTLMMLGIIELTLADITL
jgi:hypothetical protein